MMLNKNLQEINIQNMDTELVAQMFKNYQSNVLFHLEGTYLGLVNPTDEHITDDGSNKWSEGSCLKKFLQLLSRSTLEVLRLR